MRFIVFALALLVATQPALAQSEAELRADEILAEAMARYHASLEGIQAIELELLQMSVPTQMRMEVEWDEAGVPVLRPVSVTVMGTPVPAEQADFPGGAGIFETPLEDLQGAYRYEGEVEVMGRAAYHLSFTDPDPSGMGGELLEEDQLEFLDGLGALYLDTETFDLLRMEWAGEVMHEGSPESLSMYFESEGFDEVDGYRYPQVTRVETDAARFAIGDEERELLAMQLEQIRGSIPQGEIPEGEMGEMMRAVIEQADQLGRMLDEGVMEVVLEMRNVRVER